MPKKRRPGSKIEMISHGAPVVPQPVAETTTEGFKENPSEKSEVDALLKEIESLKEENRTLSDRKFSSNDLEEEVTISFGAAGSDAQGRRIYNQKNVKRKDAVEELVTYYANKKNQMVPKPDQHDADRNNSTVYCRIVKRDLETGRKIIAYQDMPLHLAATRALEGKAIEMISKAEYEEIIAQRAAEHREWAKTRRINS